MSTNIKVVVDNLPEAEMPPPASPKIDSSGSLGILRSLAVLDLCCESLLPVSDSSGTGITGKTTFSITLRSQDEPLGFDYKDENGTMLIEHITTGGPFARAGIPAGVVLLSVAGVGTNSRKTLSNATKKAESVPKGGKIKVVVGPNKKRSEIEVLSLWNSGQPTITKVASTMQTMSQLVRSSNENCSEKIAQALDAGYRIASQVPVTQSPSGTGSHPICVVCGQPAVNGVERKSGWKCKSCIGTSHSDQKMKGTIIVPEFKQHFSSFISTITNQIRMMNVKDICILPAGWSRKQPVDEELDDGGHAVLLVIHKPTVQTFTVGVITTSEGKEYHPPTPQTKPPSVGCETLRRLPLIYNDVPTHLLCNSLFWYLLWRPYLYPAPGNGPSYLYEVLLPYLNRTPARSPVFADVPGSWWQRLPPGGDKTSAMACVFAIRFGLVCLGIPENEAEWIADVKLRASLVSGVTKAVEQGAILSYSDKIVLSEAIKTTASLACVIHSSADHHRDLRKVLEQGMSAIENSGEKLLSTTSILPPPVTTDVKGAFAFPLWGSLLRRGEVDYLAGDKTAPRILLPVPLAELPEVVNSHQEAIIVLKKAVETLTLLANQHSLRNSVPLRFAFVTHLVCRVLPMPLHNKHPAVGSCFWRNTPMRWSDQQSLLRLLGQLARHFTAVSCTVRTDRESDGARIITSAGIMALTDMICRISAHDDPGLFSLHYSGKARGPVHPFGIDMSELASQTDSLLMCIPELVGLRTQVLDYFNQQRLELPDDHILFSFENGPELGAGDEQLIIQLAVSLGVEHYGGAHAARLLTGQRSELIEGCEEFIILRDTAFLLRLLLAPNVEDLPEPGKGWSATDACLSWEVGEELKIDVVGFGKNLNSTCLRPKKKVESQSVVTKFVKKIGNVFSSKKTPRNLSHADPSILAGEKIETEDDVLFITKLPDFDNALKPAEAELLLSVLTTPFLRIPLVLGFFAERERLHCLTEPTVQAVVDAALFEPSAFQYALEQCPPEFIPAETRDHLSTSTGLLFMELQTSPDATLRAIDVLLEYALEKDSGRYDSVNAQLMLYIVRLTVRVEGYIQYICRHAESHAGAKNHIGSVLKSGVRGLITDINTKTYTQLVNAAKHLRESLSGPVFRFLSRWVKRALKNHNTSAACQTYAHIALVFRNISPNDYDFCSISSILASQVFLNNFHRWGTTGLGVTDMELSDTFELHRRPIWQYLQEHDQGHIPEAVVRVATLTGDIFKANSDVAPQPIRNWVQPANLRGALVPETHAVTDEWMDPREGETYIPWLLRVTEGPDTLLLNFNFGEFSLKRQELKLVPLEVLKFPDFETVFGNEGDIHCADISVTSRRHWMRLVGRRHDIQHWDADDREDITIPSGMRRYIPSNTTMFVDGLTPSEQWIGSIFEPVRKANGALSSIDWYISDEEQSANAYGRLCGILKWDDEPGTTRPPSVYKEAIIWRSTSTVHIYDVIENGRRFYRSQRYTSNACWSFHSPHYGDGELDAVVPQRIQDIGPVKQLVAGTSSHVLFPQASITISRTISRTEGTQTYIPKRLLRGLLPDVIISRYHFWQSHSDSSLTGYEADTTAEVHSKITVQLFPNKSNDAYARITKKIQIKTSGSVYVDDPEKEALQLVNILDGRVAALATCLARLDNVSHILVWADLNGKLKTIELPRLQLSFTAVSSGLLCDQHSGMFLSTSELDDPAKQLIRQLGGGCIVLENRTGELFALTSAFETVHANLNGSSRGSKVVAVRNVSPDVPAGTEGVVISCGRKIASSLVEFENGVTCEAVHDFDIVVSSRRFQIPDPVELPSPVKCAGSSTQPIVFNSDPYCSGLSPPQLGWCHHEVPTTIDETPSWLTMVSSEVFSRRGEPAWDDGIADGARHHVFPLHLSKSFIFTPTQGSALHLALRLVLTRQFEKLATLTYCLSEATTSEDRQVWGRVIISLLQDTHADAIACRLRLSLVFAPFGEDMQPPWDIRKEIIRYIQRRHDVSSSCALSISDESLILRNCSASKTYANMRLIVNRTHFLLGSSDKPFEYDGSWNVKDIKKHSYDWASNDAAVSTFKGAAEWEAPNNGYIRPHTNWLQGADAIHYIDTQLNPGERKHSMHFMFMYELLTETIKLSISDNDDQRASAAVIARHGRFATNTGVLPAIIRVIDLNNGFIQLLPKFSIEDLPPSAGKKEKKGHAAAAQKMLSDILSKIHENSTKLLLSPPVISDAYAPISGKCKMSPDDPRWMTVPFTDDVDCNLRQIGYSPPKGTSFCAPLGDIRDAHVVFKPQISSGCRPENLKELRTSIALLKTDKVADRFKKRLITDAKLYEDCLSSKKEPDLLPNCDLSQLREQLSMRKTTDIAAQKYVETQATKKANPSCTWLARKGSKVASLDMVHLVRSFLSTKGDLVCKRLNPAFDPQIWFDVSRWLYISVRIAQTTRCIDALDSYESHLKKSPSDTLGIDLKRKELAKHIAAERHYATEADGDISSFDPRLLVFEFLFGILLREGQISLLAKFMTSVSKNVSMCHQMLMGQGKTTVIVPLLALILTNGEQLVTACMPRSLVDFSRAVLREKFNNPVLPKPVMTFDFNRITEPTQGMLFKLEGAVRQRAVVVAHPSALKSVLLKLVELMERLDADRLVAEAEKQEKQGLGTLARFKNVLGLGGHTSHTLRKGEIEHIKAQVESCKKIHKIFKAGVMLMDEVDLLLHPLKSELNWPLGEKVPLDMTIANQDDTPNDYKEENGMRYQLPWQLIDVIHHKEGEELTAFSSNKEALQVAAEVKVALSKGIESKAVQTIPHIALLSRDFYDAEIAPLMCRWCLIWLRSKRSSPDLRNEEILLFLSSPKSPPEALSERILRTSKDRDLKLLNLTAEWIHVFLPHILRRVHRVSYGALRQPELDRAIRLDPRTPKSRRLLAVPFVGKDTPSASSEFQNPDVVIGFTSLSYRFDGLRRDDFKHMLQMLKDQLYEESGIPYRQRSAVKLYVDWVRLARCRVRGFSWNGNYLCGKKDTIPTPDYPELRTPLSLLTTLI
eukprot:TRINITY_DN3976_c6_g1_i2.p1 TRINITY_DN3976_c6_g1~~TRINITY_DN3976_c6_g1_i2.p1  ORF type:complete len:3023 (+),score=543.42 TRINITY_DN3976_c6_g1_i2:1734-10802(+)